MLPPSDSFLHHSHKLREVAASTRNRVVCTPPPPYSSTVPRGVSTHEERENVEEIDDDETTWETCPNANSTPITISIDASITVVGNGNTVMIPSMAGHPQHTPTVSSMNSESSSSSSSASPATSQTDTLPFVQKQRQARLTEMATSIINALYDSGRLAPSAEDHEPAPLEIKINTGIKVEGSRNAICVGTTVRAQSHKSAQTGTDRDRQVISNRKRRALSEPLEVPKFKKNSVQ